MNQRKMLDWLGNHGYDIKNMTYERSFEPEADHHRYLIDCIYHRLRPSELQLVGMLMNQIKRKQTGCILPIEWKDDEDVQLAMQCGFIVEINNKLFLDPVAYDYINIRFF